MTLLQDILLVGLIVTAVAAPLCRRLLATVIVYMAYGLLMAVLWVLMESPDLAITEAAVGAGITSLLFFLTLKKIHAIDARNQVRARHAQELERQSAEGGERHAQ